MKNIELSSDNIILQDKTSNGKINDWHGKKLNNEHLMDSYFRLQYFNKANRVKQCGSFLEFRRYHDDTLKLNKANFCKVRLCPICSWRRSLKIFGQVSKLMNEVTKDENIEFIFLTLTAKNCNGSELSDTIDLMMNGFKLLTKTKQFKSNVLGYFRALEVTHNLQTDSKSYDTYHPHFHCILAVDKYYFKNNYINQATWTSIWKKALKIDYTPIVHVTRFKNHSGNGMAKAIAETAKYTVKDKDYIVKDDNDIVDEMLTDSAVEVLDKALSSRRLTAFGGLFKLLHKELNLDDPESGDLVNTDNDEIRQDLDYVIERYLWNIGYKQYYKI